MRRGFNLIESAIVLGVIGFVLGGIWIAAGTVNDKMQINRLQTQIGLTVQAINKNFQLYQSYSFIDLTSTLASSKLAPADMIAGSSLLDPWGQTVSVGLNTDMSLGDDAFITIQINARNLKNCSLAAQALTQYAIAINKVCASNPSLRKSAIQYITGGAGLFFGGNGSTTSITSTTSLLGIINASKTSCPNSNNTINLTIPMC